MAKIYNQSEARDGEYTHIWEIVTGTAVSTVPVRLWGGGGQLIGQQANFPELSGALLLLDKTRRKKYILRTLKLFFSQENIYLVIYKDRTNPFLFPHILVV